MKAIKNFFIALIEVIQNTKKLQAEEMKKRHFQR
jgi:hypothetical protein